MPGRPKRRERHGLDPKPWKTNPVKPARHYSWAAFEMGNEVSMRHGANCERKVEPIATELTEHLLALASEPGSPISYIACPEYLPAVRAWASAEAACQLFRSWFSEHGLFEDGETRKGMGNWDRAEGRAAKLRQRLGLDPLSRARLGRDVGAATLDLALLVSGREDDDG